MLVMSIDELRPGVRLAMSVMHPEQRSQELLRAGFCLDDAVIARLKALEVRQVFIEFPGLDELDRYVEPFVGTERRRIYDGVKAAIATAERETRPVAGYDTYCAATRDFITLLMARPENRVMLDLFNADAAPGEAVAHATTVAHLALVIGLRMETFLIRERPRLAANRARDVTNLGVAGMLHDVGKMKMRPELRERSVLSEWEDDAVRAEWESHARHSYELIHNHVEVTTAAAVLHHHQRFDGQGFPAAIRDGTRVPFAGNTIHPFARILAAADLFERLSMTDDGQRRSNYHVLELIRSRFASWIDPDVLEALPQVLPPFSPGRRVTLNDGTHGVVTGFNPKAPYRPSLKRFLNADLQLDETVVDLRDETDLEILALDGKPLKGDEAAPAALPLTRGAEAPLPLAAAA